MTPLAIPTLLAPDNFTPPQRTPWGGTKIPRDIKCIEEHDGGVVGESWEISVEPDFPSRVAGSGRTLRELFVDAPADWLGLDAKEGATALLVKLLDAAAPLSVQIHPDDEAPMLAADESGKPESWYIVAHEPGAGLYLGLREGVDESAMRAAIQGEEDVSQLLHFIPVERGDCFIIEPGTAHAIGPGVTLVEPQRVLPGRRGLTNRYWDWNRRYDAEGKLNAAGMPRPLHIEEALRVTRWDQPRGQALIEKIRHRAPPSTTAPALCTPLIGPSAPLASEALVVHQLTGTGSIPMSSADHFRGLTVTHGSVHFPEVGVKVCAGQSAAVPAGYAEEALQLQDAEAILSAAPLCTSGA